MLPGDSDKACDVALHSPVFSCMHQPGSCLTSPCAIRMPNIADRHAAAKVSVRATVLTLPCGMMFVPPPPPGVQPVWQASPVQRGPEWEQSVQRANDGVKPCWPSTCVAEIQQTSAKVFTVPVAECPDVVQPPQVGSCNRVRRQEPAAGRRARQPHARASTSLLGHLSVVAVTVSGDPLRT